MESDSDNDLDKKNLNEIESLIIDVLSSTSGTLNDENFEVFFTLLSFVEKVEEIAITLTKKLFSYFLLTISKVFSNATCNIIDSNCFTYIAIN